MKPAIKPHPALASAKRAIRRALASLTPQQVFDVAALIDTLQGRRANWQLTTSYAQENPKYRWQCDAPTPKKAGAR